MWFEKPCLLAELMQSARTADHPAAGQARAGSSTPARPRTWPNKEELPAQQRGRRWRRGSLYVCFSLPDGTKKWSAFSCVRPLYLRASQSRESWPSSGYPALLASAPKTVAYCSCPLRHTRTLHVSRLDVALFTVQHLVCTVAASANQSREDEHRHVGRQLL
jgi:hypothetical protein